MATHSNTRMVRIEWGDCDPAGIIFFPNYFRIFDHSTAMLFETVLGMTKFEMFKKLQVTGWPLVVHAYQPEGRVVESDVSLPGPLAENPHRRFFNPWGQ